MRGAGASCIGTFGSSDRAAAVRPSCSAACAPLGGRRAGDDERSGGEVDAARREALLGDLHRRGAEPVAERDHVDRPVVRHREAGRSAAGHLPLHRHRRHRSDGHLQDGRVGDLLDVHAHQQAHRPAAVVVGRQPRVGVDLLLEQVLREPPVGLVALDDVGAGRIGGAVQLELGRRLADLDPLDAQHGEQFGHARHVALDRDDVAERRLRPPVVEGVARLDVEVLDQRRREQRRELKRREDAGLHVVRVVPARERRGRVRRHRQAAVPLAVLRAAAARRKRRRAAGTTAALALLGRKAKALRRRTRRARGAGPRPCGDVGAAAGGAGGWAAPRAAPGPAPTASRTSSSGRCGCTPPTRSSPATSRP